MRPALATKRNTLTLEAHLAHFPFDRESFISTAAATACTLCTAAGMTLLSAPLLAGTEAAAAPTCRTQSTANVTPLFELYTSEGCSSCPPADRWLSALRDEPGVVALAFHVDYWDRLGWKDRFASPVYTQRQAQQRLSNGAKFSYTPQVVVDGLDRPRWYTGNAPAASGARAPARVDIELARDGEAVSASVNARPGAPARLAAYWAVTEMGHRTAVKAGENHGATLTHDFVVRHYVPIAAWNAAIDKPATFRLDLEPPQASPQPSFVNLVVVDAATQRPVQALRLGC